MYTNYVDFFYGCHNQIWVNFDYPMVIRGYYYYFISASVGSFFFFGEGWISQKLAIVLVVKLFVRVFFKSKSLVLLIFHTIISLYH